VKRTQQNLPFLDTNVFLCHLHQNDPVQSAKATEIFSNIEKGKLHVITSDFVILETVFTLQRSYKVSKVDIANAVLPLIELSGIMLIGKKRYRRIFSLYTTTSLGFVDCYHVVFMKQRKLNKIISFDRGFDKVESLKRLEL